MATNRYELTVRRAALPEVLFSSDIGLALGIPEEAAETGTRQGRFGPHFLVGGRAAVLRRDFLEALARLSARAEDGKEVLS